MVEDSSTQSVEQLLLLVDELRSTIIVLHERVAALEAENERLRQQLGGGPGSPSKPPTPPKLRDLPHFVKPNRPVREKKDKKQRRQRDQGAARRLSTPTRTQT